MPLPPSVPRDELHLRRIELRGYRRDDGLYDIEARMVDTKTRELTLGDGRVVPPGEALHDMSVRLVVDEDLNVIDIVASTDASPFGICAEATGTLQSMKGLRIAAGWSAAVRQRLAGRKRLYASHRVAPPLATVAFQTLSQVRNARPAPVDANGRPRKIDTCYAYASDREIVHRRWPMYYDGPAAPIAREEGLIRSGGGARSDCRPISGPAPRSDSMPAQFVESGVGSDARPMTVTWDGEALLSPALASRCSTMTSHRRKTRLRRTSAYR